MKTNETYLPLKRPSAGPFFKSTLAEICFIIYTKYFNCRNSITNTDLNANIAIFIVITY